MASGTDPLDRLQAGARDLRAERELCHAAADRACRAESGEAFSTHNTQYARLIVIRIRIPIIRPSHPWHRLKWSCRHSAAMGRGHATRRRHGTPNCPQKTYEMATPRDLLRGCYQQLLLADRLSAAKR